MAYAQRAGNTPGIQRPVTCWVGRCGPAYAQSPLLCKWFAMGMPPHCWPTKVKSSNNGPVRFLSVRRRNGFKVTGNRFL